MDKPTTIQITLRHGCPESVTFELELPEIMQLANLSTEESIDYLLSKIPHSNGFATLFKETPHNPQAIVELQLGEQIKPLTNLYQLGGAIIQAHLQALQAELDLMQNKLDIITAIDLIRDTEPEPEAMLKAIVSFLAEWLEADTCLLYLLDRETGAVTLKAVKEQGQGFEQLAQLIPPELAEQATQLEQVSIWSGREVLPVEIQAKLPAQIQLAAIPIIMRDEMRLGALLLARSHRPFSANDVELLDTAEGQIDSAVVQSYLYQDFQLAVERGEKLKSVRAELELKQKELALIEAIDAIRDTYPEPAAMLQAIATCLAQAVNAELCLLYLLDGESGQVVLKAASEGSQEAEPLPQAMSRELAERATQLEQLTVWQGYEVLPVETLADVVGQLHLMATPIIMGEEKRLGALVLARAHHRFTSGEMALLKIAEDQVDSAVIQGYVHDKHQSSVKELQTIYQIDHIRDEGRPIEEMLNRVLEKVCAAIETEAGFFMRYDQSKEQLHMQAATQPDLFQPSPCSQTVEQVANEALQQAGLLCRNQLGDVAYSVMALPLILNEQVIGVLGVANCQKPGDFTPADRRLLQAVGSQIDTTIYESLEKHRLQTVLRRSVGAPVMEKLLTHPNVDILKGERKVLTVLYADLRGSTDLDKFVGDEVMALFGAPIPQDDHALRAVRVGLAMQAAYQAVREYWQQRGVEAPPIGVGIATGKLTVGEMGGRQRANYTAIGRAANLGARICSDARGDQVLISQATYELVKGSVEVIPLLGRRYKGVAHEVTVYHVTRVLD
jgi:class 3 adenylate cyclase/GTP-sensing pleiotropic transcriptional regulator CodY